MIETNENERAIVLQWLVQVSRSIYRRWKEIQCKRCLVWETYFLSSCVYIYIYLSFSFFGFVQRLLVSSPCLSVKSCWVWKYRYSNQRCVHRTCWSTFSLRKDLGFFLRFEQRWFKIEEREEKEREREKKEIESRVFTTRTRDIISRASFKRCSVHSKRVEEIRAAYHIESIVIIYKASSTGCVQRLAVFPIRIISTF